MLQSRQWFNTVVKDSNFSTQLFHCMLEMDSFCREACESLNPQLCLQEILLHKTVFCTSAHCYFS